MKLSPSLTLLELCESLYFKLNTKIRHEHTKAQYRIAIKNMAAALGHEPTMDDLDDDCVALMMRYLIDKKLSPRTINERRNRIHALWHWLCKRGEIDRWPMTAKITEPHRTPQAWSEAQLRKLFTACSLLRGKRKGVPKWLWWQCLLLLLWDTGERIGAILQIKWENLDLDSRWLHVPAELRKGQAKDMDYKLAPETVGLIRMLRKYSPELVLPTLYNHQYLWQAYADLLELAGLPRNRQSMFHRIRRSVASHFEAAGGDAQRLLGHSSRSVTDGYLDPTIARSEQATDRLFRPTG